MEGTPQNHAVSDPQLGNARAYYVQLRQRTQELENAQKKLVDVESTNLRLRTKLEGMRYLRELAAETEEEIQEKNQVLQDTKARLQTAEERISVLQAQVDVKNKEVQHRLVEAAKVSESVATLQTELRSFHLHATEADSTMAELNENYEVERKKKDNLQVRFATTEARLVEVSRENKELRERLMKVEDNLSKKTLESNELHNQLSHADHENAELRPLDRDNRLLAIEVDQLRLDCSRLVRLLTSTTEYAKWRNFHEDSGGSNFLSRSHGARRQVQGVPTFTDHLKEVARAEKVKQQAHAARSRSLSPGRAGKRRLRTRSQSPSGRKGEFGWDDVERYTVLYDDDRAATSYSEAANWSHLFHANTLASGRHAGHCEVCGSQLEMAVEILNWVPAAAVRASRQFLMERLSRHAKADEAAVMQLLYEVNSVFQMRERKHVQRVRERFGQRLKDAKRKVNNSRHYDDVIQEHQMRRMKASLGQTRRQLLNSSSMGRTQRQRRLMQHTFSSMGHLQPKVVGTKAADASALELQGGVFAIDDEYVDSDQEGGEIDVGAGVFKPGEDEEVTPEAEFGNATGVATASPYELHNVDIRIVPRDEEFADVEQEFRKRAARVEQRLQAFEESQRAPAAPHDYGGRGGGDDDDMSLPSTINAIGSASRAAPFRAYSPEEQALARTPWTRSPPRDRTPNRSLARELNGLDTPPVGRRSRRGTRRRASALARLGTLS